MANNIITYRVKEPMACFITSVSGNIVPADLPRSTRIVGNSEIGYNVYKRHDRTLIGRLSHLWLQTNKIEKVDY